MSAASNVWTKAEQSAGDTGKDLDFDSDLGEVIDDMDTQITKYLALEAKLYKIAKKIFIAGKKVGRAAKSDLTTIREAKATASGPQKAGLEKMGAGVEDALSTLKETSVDDYMFRTKRQLAMARKVIRTLK